MIEFIYDFIIKLLIYTDNLNLDDIIVHNFEMFKKISLLGLLNQKCKTSFSQNLTLLINTCKTIKYSFFPVKLFQCFFENINMFTEDSSSNKDSSNQSLGVFIDLLILLFEVLLELNEINVIKPFISIIIDTILTEIQTEDKSVIPVDIFVGYMQIINVIKSLNIFRNLH